MVQLILIMSKAEIFWVDLQPTLYCLNTRVAQLLSRKFIVQRWSFQHDLDESCSIDTIHHLLNQTLQTCPQPIHLIGHGISGTVSCLFANKYPHLVKSVTMLSVDTLSANHWSSHYLTMRSQLPCAREKILTHLSSLLFPQSSSHASAVFPRLLAKCLDTEFIQGSIVSQEPIGDIKVPAAPVLVLNGEIDFVVDTSSRDRWSRLLKAGDRYQPMKQGRHFFQFNQSENTAKCISSFIEMIPDSFVGSHLDTSSIELINLI